MVPAPAASLLALLLTSSPAPQDAVTDPGPGISETLARARATLLDDVAARLTIELQEGADTLTGHVELSFELPAEGPAEAVVVDFAGLGLEQALVNGIETDVRWEDGHVLLPASALTPGRNTFAARFRAAVAPTGTPHTVYRDEQHEEEYHYTLVVPADAHRLFPCFDQPDLKMRVRLALVAPADWRVVANGPADGEPQPQTDGRLRHEFLEAPPLSTYLIAYAAGPFDVVEGADLPLDDPRGLRRLPEREVPVASEPPRPLRIFVRPSRRADLQATLLDTMHRRAVDWLERYFDFPYPFAKLDIVLLPGFPYGGMEHAGCIFYRESALVFDHVPTVSEEIRRSTLIYHEVCHQWFGNLVTMRWFDDLWLKEGFATFVGYKLLGVLERRRAPWLRFLQRVKPGALRIDATVGTTPIYQSLANLADAKSAYGPIVYNKAPAVLRELEARLGEDGFRQGVADFLKSHAYANATWQDLVTALEQAGGGRLERWSERWILARGLPEVSVEWRVADGALTELAVVQRPSAGADAGTWPMRVDVLVDQPDGPKTFRVDADEARTVVADAAGLAPPRWVLLNPGDVAYARFLLDADSAAFLVENPATLDDPLRRAVALSALRETMREGELDPAAFARLLLARLPLEDDADTRTWLLGSLRGALRHTDDARRPALREAAEAALEELLTTLPADERLSVYRALLRLGGPRGRAVATTALSPQGLQGLALGLEDRFLAVAALLAGDEAERTRGQAASDRLAAEPNAARHAYIAGAAAADAATKERYWQTYLQPTEPPEQWMSESLAFFHWPGQDARTLPYLEKALERVEWVKANRKIFFMPAWIDAFVNGHGSAAALAIVEGFLDRRDDLPADIRKKVQQSVDDLRRVVRARDRWR